MGKEKAGFLTPKAIGNRIKSKGLQKLRCYCQICQKQCRDENGFKCHCMSESHQRQLLLVGQKPGQFTNAFSDEFLEDFLDILKRRFNGGRVHNNVVYNEYISAKEHIHMTATRWVTLTGFTKWLGRQGICKVDETEKGWFLEYIDQDPEVIRRQKELERAKRKEKGDERHARAIEKMVGLRKGKERVTSTSSATELHRVDEEEKVAFTMQNPALGTKKPPPIQPQSLQEKLVKLKPNSANQYHKLNKKRKKTALEEIMKRKRGKLSRKLIID